MKPNKALLFTILTCIAAMLGTLPVACRIVPPVTMTTAPFARHALSFIITVTTTSTGLCCSAKKTITHHSNEHLTAVAVGKQLCNHTSVGHGCKNVPPRPEAKTYRRKFFDWEIWNNFPNKSPKMTPCQSTVTVVKVRCNCPQVRSATTTVTLAWWWLHKKFHFKNSFIS